MIHITWQSTTKSSTPTTGPPPTGLTSHTRHSLTPHLLNLTAVARYWKSTRNWTSTKRRNMESLSWSCSSFWDVRYLAKYSCLSESSWGDRRGVSSGEGGCCWRQGKGRSLCYISLIFRVGKERYSAHNTICLKAKV